MDRDARARWLGACLVKSVRLTYTQNRSRMVSARMRDNTLDVRVHSGFARAPEIVWQALALYLRRADVEAGELLRGFIRHHVRPHRKRPVVTATANAGRFHNLDEIRNELNERYFSGSCRAQITWGGASRRRRRRSIQLGSYTPDDQLIRIHPCLDQEFVPRYYISWVVFHEMLHEIFGQEQIGKRLYWHSPAFVAMEETYPDHDRCTRWEEENLPRLLRFQGPTTGERGSLSEVLRG